MSDTSPQMAMAIALVRYKSALERIAELATEALDGLNADLRKAGFAVPPSP